MEITQPRAGARTHDHLPVGPDPLPPVGLARMSLAAFAALATLPYLVLKVAWLSGSRVGILDPEFGTGAEMDVLNALTLGLDVVALALAVTFATRRGLRAPAWLVVPPMWVGAGLLGQILVSLPVSLVAQAVSPSRPTPGQLPPIAEWVFTLVYAGFAGLGVGLLGAFALYAWTRWGRRGLPPVTAVARTALTAAAILVLVAGGVHAALSAVPLSARLLDLVVVAVTAGSLVALARPGAGGRTSVIAVVLVFVGTGALAAWGTYIGVLHLMPNDLVGQSEIDWVTVGTSALRVAAGLAGAAALAARMSRPTPASPA